MALVQCMLINCVITFYTYTFICHFADMDTSRPPHLHLLQPTRSLSFYPYPAPEPCYFIVSTCAHITAVTLVCLCEKTSVLGILRLHTQ